MYIVCSWLNLRAQRCRVLCCSIGTSATCHSACHNAAATALSQALCSCRVGADDALKRNRDCRQDPKTRRDQENPKKK